MDFPDISRLCKKTTTGRQPFLTLSVWRKCLLGKGLRCFWRAAGSPRRDSRLLFGFAVIEIDKERFVAHKWARQRHWGDGARRARQSAPSSRVSPPIPSCTTRHARRSIRAGPGRCGSCSPAAPRGRRGPVGHGRRARRQRTARCTSRRGWPDLRQFGVRAHETLQAPSCGKTGAPFLAVASARGCPPEPEITRQPERIGRGAGPHARPARRAPLCGASHDRRGGACPRESRVARPPPAPRMAARAD